MDLAGKFSMKENPVLPGNLRTAVFEEVRRTFVYPYSTFLCLAGNAILVTLLWFFVPTGYRSLFFNVQGIFFFPIVLASWMVADVPATNEWAPDSLRVLAAMGDEAMLTRLLRAKHLVLWIFVTPIVITVAAIIGGVTGDRLSMILCIGWVASVPLSSLGLASLVGIIWPYHPIPLKIRLKKRRQWKHMWLRWSVLVVIPYVIVPLFAAIGFGPTLILFKVAKLDHTTVHRGALMIGLVITVPLAAFVWTWGTRYGARLTTKRAAQLRLYLSDPLKG